MRWLLACSSVVVSHSVPPRLASSLFLKHVSPIKGKLFAASRAGIHTVVLPRRNEKDLTEVPEEVKAQLDIRLVDEIGEALAITLSADDSPTA